MSDNDDQNTGGNVINFGRRTGLTGFTLTPTPPSSDNSGLGPVIPPQPATAPTNGTGARTRRSPLDALAALPSPTLTAPPVVATPHPDGGLPDTFRGPNSGAPVGPRMGALSMAATLAVAVAALRGSCIVLEDWRQRRMAKAAETKPMREARAKHKLAMAEARFGSTEAAAKHANSMQGIGNKSAEKRAKKVPSSQTFGRKTLGGGSTGGSAGGGGKGASGGSKKSARTGSGSGSGSSSSSGGRSSNSKGKGLFGSGAGGRGTGNTANKGGGASPKKSPTLTNKKPKSPHRGSQGAGAGLKKNHNGKTTGTGGANGRGGSSKNTPNPKLKKQQPGNKGSGRTTLGQAAARQLGKTTQRRLKQRRKNLNKPALWNSPAAKKNGQGPKSPKTTQPGPGATPKQKTNLRKPTGTKQRRAGRTTLAGAMGRSAYQAARTRLKKRRHSGTTPPVWGAARKPRTKTPPTTNTKKQMPKNRRSGAAWAKQQARQAGSWTRRGWQRARTRAQKAATHGGGFPGSAGSSAGAGSAQQTTYGPTSGGPGPGRKSPFQNASNTGPATWTVTRDDQPAPTPNGPAAGITAGVNALPAAPEPHTARPGTTRPQEAHPMPPVPVPAQDPRLQKARNQAARRGAAVAAQAGQMDAQHATEINLDDSLDEYGDFKDDGFKTHAQCSLLSGRARKLRDTLGAFAEDLAVNHNLIGPLFAGAMASLAESMELVARMADEMEISSLEAAEMAETADNELNDAYRPYNVATADAGLTTPSAPIHNKA
ncbi:hypothetical protein [Streptomyces sp. NPDC055105]|uniref:hypothetical protein n=1 Tax=Streptomyces sp. NPDC055105 TaxID=3365719 RepID=UPI0037D67A1B